MEQEAEMSVDFTRSIISLFETRIGLKSDAFKPRAWKGMIAKRMEALSIREEEEYYKLLLRSEREFLALTELVVVPETFFFREPIAIEHAVEIIRDRGAGKCMRVLCVACSSGEEPYSLAMSLESHLVPKTYYQIDAVDISKSVIAAALEGVYRLNSFRGECQEYRDRFFDTVDRRFAIKEKVKKGVTFFVGNAVEDKFMRGHDKYDIIFCRNLFIYLTNRAQTAVLQKLASLLSPDGVLFVGTSEAETFRRLGWIPTGSADACCYVPPRLESAKLQLARQVLSRKSIPEPPPSVRAKNNPLEEALNLANRGLYTEALEVCRQYIKEEGKVKAHAYYLKGVIEHACDLMDAAEESFAKTVYLQPDNVEALTYLALLADRRGDKAKGDLYRQRISRIGGENE